MAIAGKVAISPKGEWSANVAYTKLDLVTYNGDAYIAYKDSTGITPTNTEYWMLTLDNVAQDKIDAIQTTSQAILGTAGWYRVAEYSGSLGEIKGENWSNSCEIIIKRRYSTSQNETYRIQFSLVFGKIGFKILESVSKDYQLFKKIRYTYNASEPKGYIEVYYSENKSNPCQFDILFGKADNAVFKAITPTLTSETVDGVTVTTTYDIPANATPVTDLDLVRFNGTESLTTSILDKALEVGRGIWEYRLNNVDLTDLPHSQYGYSTATIRKHGDNAITVILWGHNNGNCNRIATNRYNGTNWRGWEQEAITADLANYLGLGGGYITGSEAGIGKPDSQTGYTWGFKNANRYMGFQVLDWGAFRLVDLTSGMGMPKVFDSIKSGSNIVNTFYGTASGNLPLNGGGTVSKSNNDVLTLKNTSSIYNYLKFEGKAGLLGGLGFSGADVPVFLDSTGGTTKRLLHVGNYSDYALPKTEGVATTFTVEQDSMIGVPCIRYRSNGDMLGYLGIRRDGELGKWDGNAQNGVTFFHTGNSAPVKIQESAPSDTTALWVDSTNKKTKAYIDGAWTVIA